ncbi:MAG: hypothetical protein KKD39_06855 [Candidatus Altiarchaeota archaeon]|nr:hypothetical protein [Candidatus Altiarchaeota archaeon]
MERYIAAVYLWYLAVAYVIVYLLYVRHKHACMGEILGIKSSEFDRGHVLLKTKRQYATPKVASRVVN